MCDEMKAELRAEKYPTAKSYSEKLETGRISSGELFRSQAERKFKEGHELENLAKLFDTLPKEIEAALFPLVAKYFNF